VMHPSLKGLFNSAQCEALGINDKIIPSRSERAA
jgi:hypothetical protein